MGSGTQKMIFATGEPACAIDRNGTIVAWNAAATRALGYPRSGAIGEKCWNLLQGQDAFGNQYCGENCPLQQMAFQRRAVNRCRMSFRSADKQWQRFTVTTLALFDTDEAALIHLWRKESQAGRTEGKVSQQQEPGPGRGVLTPRERQVLDHLANGHTTREIATLLSISVPTVRSHIEHILHKLHAHSRLEAVAVSRRLGLH